MRYFIGATTSEAAGTGPSSDSMVDQSIDRRIGLARSVLDRLDAGEPLSALLPTVKTLAQLLADEDTVALLDIAIYGLSNIPDHPPPFPDVDDSYHKATLLWMKLARARDPDDLTIDKILRDGLPTELKMVVPSSMFELEGYEPPPTLEQVPSPKFADRIVQASHTYKDTRGVLYRVRSYFYDYVSAKWGADVREKDRIELLGQDYHLVLGSLSALDTTVGEELAAALDQLTSENAASWSLAAVGCRAVVLKLGRQLYQLRDAEYESVLLEKTLNMTGDSEKNRLSAYIDTKWRSADQRNQELLEEAMKLVAPIYDMGSKGKAGARVRHSEAQTLVQDTFRLVDCLDRATGMEPIR